MLILELAVQGVRGFSPSARIGFKPGYVVLKSPTEIPAPLAGLTLSLLYPDGRGGEAAFQAPGAKVGRAGLSLQSDDQSLWRVVRDLGGQGALNRLNANTNQYEVLTQDASEFVHTLKQAGFPVRATFEQLFTFTVGQLPSRKPKPSKSAQEAQTVKMKAAAPMGHVESAFDSYAAELSASESGPSVEKLAALEKELVLAKHVAQQQFKMDGVQADAFKAEQRFAAYQDLKTRLEAAREELHKAPTAQSLGLPEDIVERVRRSSEDKKKREVALNKLQREMADAGIPEVPSIVAPVWKDRPFLAGVAVGVVLLIAGLVFQEGSGRFLALLAIPAFTVAGLLLLRYVEELQHLSREATKREVFDGRRKKIEDEFSASQKLVETAMDKVEANTPDEFYTMMAKRAELEPNVHALEMEFADYEADPDTASLGETVARLKQEHEQMNQELLRLSGGYSREVREIEREIVRMKDALAGKTTSSSSEEFGAVDTDPEERFDDPCPAAIQLASTVFQSDIPTLWGVIRDRCVQYLVALTDKRYHAMDLDGSGHCTVQAPGRTIAAGELPGKDLDLVYLSLRLTLAEKCGAQTKLPVILEDAFGGVIDLNKQPLFARMLKHIGTLTQVLHVIGAAQTPPQADALLAV